EKVDLRYKFSTRLIASTAFSFEGARTAPDPPAKNTSSNPSDAPSSLKLCLSFNSVSSQLAPSTSRNLLLANRYSLIRSVSKQTRYSSGIVLTNIELVHSLDWASQKMLRPDLVLRYQPWRSRIFPARSSSFPPHAPTH